jgi:hypothetical protein
MPRWPGFISGADTAATLIGSAADTVNWYVERLPEGGANAACLLPTPGFRLWSTANTVDHGTRALLYVENRRLFAVMGARLWEFFADGTGTARGTVGTDQARAQLVYNHAGQQLGIASAGSIFSFDLATNTLTGPYLSGGYTHLNWAMSTGLALNPTTGRVNLSALNDLTTWNAGQFFERSLFGDPWRAMFVDQNNLVWLIGTDSFETWYHTGQGTQPFAPLSGLNGLMGIVGPWAYAVGQVGNVWLARNQHGEGLLVETHGGPPAPVSSRAMATAGTAAARRGGLAQTEVSMHQLDAHVFTWVTLLEADETWAYDHLEQGWARRGQWNPETGRFAAWYPRLHVFAFGAHVVGDGKTSWLGAMDPTLATELDGSGIRRLRRAPALVNEKRRAPIDQLELLLDVGLGVQTGQGAPPEILLRVSDDGGRTFGNSLRASTGAAGAWGTRVYWTRLGLVQDAVIELTCTDPVPYRLVDCYVNNLEAA